MTAGLPKGFTVRPVAMEDLEAAVALFNACSMELIGAVQHDVDETRVEWGTPGFNLKTDTQVVLSPAGEIVGYIEVWDIEEPHVQIWSWGRVHPDYRGKGIGTYLLRWAEDRARKAIPKAPSGARVVLRHGALHQDKPAQALLAHEGFKLIRHFWRMVVEMDGPPPTPVWPEGIVVRTFVPEQEDRALATVLRDMFKDHWGYVKTPFEEELVRWQHWMKNDKDFDPSLWFLAMDGDEITGASLCSPKTNEDPDMGYVHALGVRRPWRRRGIALALLHHSFGEFFNRFKSKVSLHVDAKSLTGATRLYEKAGMHVDRLSHHYEKELRPGKDLSTQSVA